MTLAEAIADLAERRIISAEPAVSDVFVIASGGVTDDADTPPMLCATREIAVAAWLEVVCDFTVPGDTIRWAEPPGMYRFQVTVSNADTMTHRIAGDRFAVVSSLSVNAA